VIDGTPVGVGVEVAGEGNAAGEALLLAFQKQTRETLGLDGVGAGAGSAVELHRGERAEGGFLTRDGGPVRPRLERGPEVFLGSMEAEGGAARVGILQHSRGVAGHRGEEEVFEGDVLGGGDDVVDGTHLVVGVEAPQHPGDAVAVSEAGLEQPVEAPAGSSRMRAWRSGRRWRSRSCS